jgi:uncharacterized protein YjiS (DUF1127 family)
MSVVISRRAPSHGWIQEIVDWFGQMRVAAGLPRVDASEASEPVLRDLGLDRLDIAREVERATFEIGLLSTGWQPARKPVRRR